MMLMRLKTVLITHLMIAFIPWSAWGQQVSEYRVKAAFLYNFAKFVDWPACNHCYDADVFTIGILGQDPFGEEIKTIVGKRVKDRTLMVLRAATLDELKTCQVIFISGSFRKDLPKILQKLRGRPILTVGDMPGFAEAGGMINLYMADNKVRFEINPVAAEQAKLKISSQLLKLARIVPSRSEHE